MTLFRYGWLSLQSILANKMRSLLTMLGVIIGVAAVLITLGIGAGASASITADIESQGTNLLTVTAMNGANTLTLGDAAMLEDRQLHPEIDSVVPEYTAQAAVAAGENNESAQIVGASPEYAVVRNLEVAQGSFFTAAEVESQATVAVLGATLAQDLFGSSDAVGRQFRIGNQPMTVIGVLKESGGAGFGSNDSRVFAPLSTVQGRLFAAPRYRGDLTLTGLSIAVGDSTLMDTAEKRVEETLRLRHALNADDDNDFSIFNQASLLDIAGSVTTTLSIFFGSIGAVSLLVGGIGIMNIMLVAVTERTKEIGLRRAVGARDRDILLQFLIEALVLCLLGGAIGASISYGLGGLVGLFPAMPFEIIISGEALALALGVSTATGFIFGLYPALRATRLDPIEALRYE
ncbi:MAG: ABC transporter permease [Anaerolineales bacterium]|nr:ABC transporter permease [Anaerolineales bacterium]